MKNSNVCIGSILRKSRCLRAGKRAVFNANRQAGKSRIPYSPVDASLNGIFLSAMKEADEWHIQRNQAYARLYEAHPQPDIPVSLFKSADLATPVIDEGQWLTSSGTGSGQKTRVF